LESYRTGGITAQGAAEVLDMSLREFLSLLEKQGVPVNWDSNLVREYMTKHYGE
jgi:predicted HTH domain antitoxin